MRSGSTEPSATVTVAIVLGVFATLIAYQFGMHRAFEKAGRESHRRAQQSYIGGVCDAAFEVADAASTLADTNPAFFRAEASDVVVELAERTNEERARRILRIEEELEEENRTSGPSGEWVCALWAERLRGGRQSP